MTKSFRVTGALISTKLYRMGCCVVMDTPQKERMRHNSPQIKTYDSVSSVTSFS